MASEKGINLTRPRCGHKTAKITKKSFCSKWLLRLGALLAFVLFCLLVFVQAMLS